MQDARANGFDFRQPGRGKGLRLRLDEDTTAGIEWLGDPSSPSSGYGSVPPASSGATLNAGAGQPPRRTHPVKPAPLLYIDDYTVLEEIDDLTQLRRGDHCVVGLNAMRKCGPFATCIDRVHVLLGRFEILRMYHHFIMYDDVAALAPHPVVGPGGRLWVSRPSAEKVGREGGS